MVVGGHSTQEEEGLGPGPFCSWAGGLLQTGALTPHAHCLIPQTRAQSTNFSRQPEPASSSRPV